MKWREVTVAAMLARIRGTSGRTRVAGVAAGLSAIALAAVLATRPGSPSVPPVTALASPSGTPAPSTSSGPSPSLTPSPTPSPTPTALPAGVADLTGQHVSDALAHRLPIAVLIDDNRVARPQSGFNAASVVYQAPADGGETRYMLVFQEGESRDIGPVRSGRAYFIHWASEARAGIAHYGGDKISRDYFKAHDGSFFTDIDALRTTGKPFHRISTRNPPHNAYTNTSALRRALLALHGPALMPTELGRRAFVDPAATKDRGSRQSITVPYRTGIVRYVFDRSSDLYERFVDGHRQVDPADGHVVTTRNVIVLFMSFHTDSKIEIGHARPVLGDIGTGRALVFRDGHLIRSTWTKPDATGLTRLVDAAGHEIPLARGRTFFQIVPLGTKVTPGR